MNFQDYSPYISFILPIALFILNYRNVVTARKERELTAYYEIIKTLLRTLVNNNYIPSVPEINRLLNTKAIEKKLNVNNLPDEITFIHALYTRVIDDEIISSDEKTEFISKINEYLEKQEKSPFITTDDRSLLKNIIKKENWNKISLFLFPLIVTIATVFVFIYSSPNTSGELSNNFTFIVSIIAAIIGLVIAYLFTYLKEEPNISRKSILNEYINFEDRILKILRNFDSSDTVILTKNHNRIEFDISFKKDAKTFLVEVKLFKRYVPVTAIRRLEKQASFAKEIDKDYILILVVNNKKYLGQHLARLQNFWDYIFDEKELRIFRNELTHK